jgi:hypothetical protein
VNAAVSGGKCGHGVGAGLGDYLNQSFQTALGDELRNMSRGCGIASCLESDQFNPEFGITFPVEEGNADVQQIVITGRLPSTAWWLPTPAAIEQFVTGGYGGRASRAASNRNYGAAAGHVVAGTLYGVANVVTLGNGGRVVSGLNVVGNAAAGLAARVKAVHGALDPIAAAQRTTAVLDTIQGTRVLAAGGKDLTPAQRALMTHGEVAARLPGAHAEVTALQHAAQNGLTPAEMAVSRTICSACKAAIEESGGQLTSPTTAIWPR